MQRRFAALHPAGATMRALLSLVGRLSEPLVMVQHLSQAPIVLGVVVCA